jgi:glutathione synthase/RimK-type ligase-like ATP-grasp enzyme
VCPATGVGPRDRCWPLRPVAAAGPVGRAPAPGPDRTIARVSKHIAIATCSQLSEVTEDDGLLIAALAERGLPATLVPWTAADVDWSGFAATVIRSTWDYPSHRTEFLAWADSVPGLFNPAGIVRANSDKRYLAGLAGQGVPIVPTDFFDPGERVRLPDAGEFVIKPSVGAGSKGAGRFGPGARAQALEHAAELQALGRTVMVQPYLAEVDASGETALIFIDGRYSHAICKSALLPPQTRHRIQDESIFVTEVTAPREPSAAERALAEQVLSLLGDDPLLYARVDLLPGPAGPVVIELELTEPSLFLGYAEGAAGRLAAAIQARVG